MKLKLKTMLWNFLTQRLHGLTSTQEKLLAHLKKSYSTSKAMNGCH